MEENSWKDDVKTIATIVDPKLTELSENHPKFQMKLSDHIRSRLNVKRRYEVKLPSRKDWEQDSIITAGFDSVWMVQEL